MQTVTKCIPGLRVLRQDPWECLISFITSSNNNIKRIIQGLQKLREVYGDYLCTLHPPCEGHDDWSVQYSPPAASTGEKSIPNSTTQSTKDNGLIRAGSTNSTTGILQLHKFPSPEQFQVATESNLRSLGMGYRAR